MRLVGVVAMTIGCGSAAPVAELPPLVQPGQPDQPAYLMTAEELTTRMSGLRATLARSNVEIDTVDVIDTCAGDGYRDGDRAHCVRCEVARRENTGGVDPDLIDAVAIAFALYPPKLMAATELRHVALCRSIRTAAGTEAEKSPGGVAIAADHRLLVSVEQFVTGAGYYRDYSVAQVVHHEMFHLFDHATSPQVHADKEWAALNPPGFAYQDPAAKVESRPAGFVTRYGTTNELEDRATIFEFLIGQPAKMCEIAHEDPVVAAKAATVWKRVAKVSGEGMLRRSAPCVDWIGKRPAKPKPAPKPKPKPNGPVNLQLQPDTRVLP